MDSNHVSTVILKTPVVLYDETCDTNTHKDDKNTYNTIVWGWWILAILNVGVSRKFWFIKSLHSEARDGY